MKLSTPRYSFNLVLQFLSIIIDLFFNCLSLFPRSRDGLLVIFIFQDLFIMLAIFYLMLTIFSTYLFQAGLMEVLFRKFRVAGVVCISYLAATVTLHVFWLLEKWNEHDSISTPPLIFLFTVQRCLSPWYYFFYKRAALRISDPRFYEDIDWINRQLQTR